MDPDQTWKDLVGMADEVSNGMIDFAVPGVAESYADGMAELIVSLRDWIASGGFPPAAFERVKERSALVKGR